MANNYLINSEKQLLLKSGKSISEYTNQEFATVVNAFGVCHQSEPLFAGLSRGFDASAFTYLTYFLVPVNKEHGVVLPRAFVYQARKYQSANSSHSRENYYATLKNLEQLATCIKHYSGGVEVHCDLFTDIPFGDSKEYLITDVDKAKDVEYVIARFYSN